MEAMSPGSDDDNNSPERHHRDDAETIDKLTKERFRLQLRIYHMEEQMKETHGADWKSSLNQKIELEECRVELEEKLKLLTQSAKMIEQLKIQLTTSETAKQKLTEERDNALRDVSNIEVKYRRIEEENTRLLEDLKSAQSQSRRNREKINLDFEDNENRLRQSERSLRDVENRLNDSQTENDRLHDKLQDLQNNNNSIDDELNRKYEEVNNLKEDNDELIEEVERLREDLGRAQQEREKHRRRKYNVFEVGVQCETRMCEKAVQTKSISTSSLRESSSTTIASSNHHLRSSNNHTSSSTTTRNPSSSRMTNSSLRRTSSVDNLSSRPNLLAKYTQQSSPVSSSSTRDRYKQSYGDRDRGGAAPVQSYNDRYAEPASSVKSGETYDYYYNMLRFESPEGSLTDEPVSIAGSGAIRFEEEEEELYGEEDRFDHFDRVRARRDPFADMDRRGRDRGPPPAAAPRRRTNSYDGRRATQRQKEFDQHVAMRRSEMRQQREPERRSSLTRRSSHRSNPQLAVGGLAVRDFDRSFNHRDSYASPPGSDRSAPIGRLSGGHRPSPRGHSGLSPRDHLSRSMRNDYDSAHSRSMKNLDRITRSIRDIRGTSEEDYELINA